MNAVTAGHARVTTFAFADVLLAGIGTLTAARQATAAAVLAGELLEVLEGLSRDGDVGPCESPSIHEEHPRNAEQPLEEVHRDLKPQDLVLAIEPNRRSARSGTAVPGAQRTREYRARKKAVAIAVDSKQLAFVTERHAMSVTSVTCDVTRHAAALSDSPSPERPSKGLSGEGETLRSSVTVTDDGDVTLMPELLPKELRDVFEYVLARRPAGIVLNADDLWAKFRAKDAAKIPSERIASRPERSNRWRYWCGTEWPATTKYERPVKVEAASLPVSSPQVEVEKREPMPGVRSAPVDPEERSRRVEAEYYEKRAREHAERAASAEAMGMREIAARSMETLGFAPRRAS